MNENRRGERGIALVIVMILALVCLATATAIYTGFRVQINAAGTIQGSQDTLTNAENGLALAVTLLSKSPAYPPALPSGSDPLFFHKTDGSNVTVTAQYVTGCVNVISTATRGRFSRTVMVKVTYPSPTYSIPPIAFFSDGSVDLTNGTINASIFSNYNITIKNATVNGNVSTPGAVTTISLQGGHAEVTGTIETGANDGQPIPFPEVKWYQLQQDAGFTATTEDEFKAGILWLQANNGGILAVTITSLLHVNAVDYTNVPGTIVVMKPRSSASDNPPGNPSVFFNNFSMTGTYDLLVEGSIDLKNVKSPGLVTQGIVYSGAKLDFANDALNVTGGIVSKGASMRNLQVQLDSTQWDDLLGDNYVTWGSTTVDNSHIVVTDWHEP